MKRGLLICLLLVVLMLTSVNAKDSLLVLPHIPTNCQIYSVNENGGTNYYLNSSIDIFGIDGSSSNSINIRLPPIENILFENSKTSGLHRYMHYDFDASGSNAVGLYYSRGNAGEGGTYTGFLIDGTMLNGEYSYYNSYGSDSDEFFMNYAGIDLVDKISGERITGRIKFLVRYNITTDEYLGGCFHQGYLYIDDTNLESWKSNIESMISDIWDVITGLITTREDHEDRISTLENNNITSQNQTFPNYLKYLDSSTRKDIVCGYAEDNHLSHLEDLGWGCDITYRQTRRGEQATCRCKKI